jgi:very-short-patch-repair endonuclease
MNHNLNLARALRHRSTDAEKRLWERLRVRRLDGLKFKRQVPIGKHIADFVCFDARLIVEIDGGHHAEQTLSDAERTRSLEESGFLVLRFWNSDVMARIEQVVAAISETALYARRKDEIPSKSC